MVGFPLFPEICFTLLHNDPAVQQESLWQMPDSNPGPISLVRTNVPPRLHSSTPQFTVLLC